MKLSFYARAGHVVQFPGVKVAGMLPEYVGRSNEVVEGVGWKHPATKDPVTVEQSSKAGRRLSKVAKRDQSLWPADKATAVACQMPFVEVELVNGEYRPATAKQIKKGNS